MDNKTREILKDWTAIQLMEFIENNTAFGDSIEDELQEKISFASYKEDFNKKWASAVCMFNNKEQVLKYVGASLWLTDCDDDYTKFAEWFFKEEYEVEDTFLSCDITVSTPDNISADDSVAIYSMVGGILGGHYSQTDEGGFYRLDEELSEPKELPHLFDVLLKADKAIEGYLTACKPIK